jgi:UDP-glucose:glycoprotein glucosyltransferase
VIVPVDFSDAKDVAMIVETLQSFVKRKVPVRFGLVPLTESSIATDQARILYHLIDNYGLPAALGHLDTVS